jgi:transposase
MLGHKEFQPQLFSSIDIVKLIPKNHLLRKIEASVDFSFIKELTRDLYCQDNGRPSIDPEVFFRIYLISFLYGINSDRQVCEEIRYNLLYRWFCKLNLEDTVPDHSSLTKIRDRMGEETFKKIFERIVNLCFERGLAKGTKVMMDGSMVKADAALRSMVDRPRDGESLDDIEPPKYIKDRRLRNKEHISKTDPDCSLAGKQGEPKKLAYKVHNTIDRESRIVLDTHASTGVEMEGNVMMNRIDAYEKNFGKQIEEATADRGYGYGVNLTALDNRGITHFIPRFRPDAGDRVARDSEGFTFNRSKDCYVCPKGHEMSAIQGPTPEYKRYRMTGGHCSKCPLKASCLNLAGMKARGAKHIEVSIYHDALERTAAREPTDEFRKMRGERQWKMEGSFAEAKENHCLNRARYRGLSKMQIQSYMIGLVLNLKRLAAFAVLPIVDIYFEILSLMKFRKSRNQKNVANFFEIRSELWA